MLAALLDSAGELASIINRYKQKEITDRIHEIETQELSEAPKLVKRRYPIWFVFLRCGINWIKRFVGPFPNGRRLTNRPNSGTASLARKGLLAVQFSKP